MRRLSPCQTQLVVTGDTYDVVGFIEVAARCKTFLETMQAQKLDILGDVGITNVRVVATGALHLIVFQRHQGSNARRTIGDVGLERGITQLTVGIRQRAVVGKGNRMIVAQIGAELTRKPGAIALARGHDPAGAGARHVDGHVALPVGHVNLSNRDGAIVAG